MRPWRRVARRLTVAMVSLVAVGIASAGTAAAPAMAGSTASGPVKASAHLYLPDSWLVLGHLATVPRRVIHVKGVVRPFVPGQRVIVRVLLGHRRVKLAYVRVHPSAGGHTGHFSQTFASPGAGEVTVIVTHHRNSAMSGFLAQRRLTALDEHVGFGSTGRFVVLMQQRLAALHLYIPQTGVYDAGMGWALDAYHRLLRWGTSQNLDGRTISYLLDGFGAFKVRYPHHGRHAEANLSLQLLALINGSHVERIEPTSSGKPSTPTVLGDYRIYMREPGYNSEGMYYSDYFIRGYAIHGYDPAPDYPASHGCIRIPIADAIPTFNWLAMGDWVDVYY